VGIAGLALGGGVGLASRKYGLTCDNLLEATVVLANGTAVAANAREHPDLYWALRGGGGGNFGIVTRLVFRTHPVGQVATYALEWPWSDAAKVVQAWQKLAPHAPDGLFSVLNLNAVAGGHARITSAGQFFGSADRLRELVKPLANAGAPTRFTVTSRSYIDAQEMWAGCSGTIAECHLPPQGHLGRSTFKGKSSFANKPAEPTGDQRHDPPDRCAHHHRHRLGNHPARLLRRRHQPREEGRHRIRAPGCTVLDAVPRLLGRVGAGGAEPPLAEQLLRGDAPLRVSVRVSNYIDPELGKWGRAYWTNLDRLIAFGKRPAELLSL
jgi:hypothetical protein